MKHSVCVLLAMLLLFALAAPALADCPLKVEVILDRYRFPGPDRVKVRITVTNDSSGDMPGPCALYDPTGSRITAFGTPVLAAGESASWSGIWQVTAQQLQKGKIVFALAWAEPDSDGTTVLRQQAFYTAVSRTVTLDEQQLAQVAEVCFSHAVSLLGRVGFPDFHLAGQT